MGGMECQAKVWALIIVMKTAGGKKLLRSIVNKNDENSVDIVFVWMATQQEHKFEGWEEWHCNISTEDIEIKYYPGIGFVRREITGDSPNFM